MKDKAVRQFELGFPEMTNNLKTWTRLCGWLPAPKVHRAKLAWASASSFPGLPAEAEFTLFLNFPGEIRNRIYEYALTEPDGLHCHYFKKGNELTSSPLHQTSRTDQRWRLHPNQLKFTCWQMWHETRGLGLKYNDLHFTRSHESHPFASQRAMGFLKDFRANNGPNRLNWIRRVTITNEASVEMAGWAGKCCKTYTRCWIKDHDQSCTKLAGYNRTTSLIKFACRHPHIRFEVDMSLPPHEVQESRPSMYRLVVEILRHIVLFRGIPWYDLPLDLPTADRLLFEEEPIEQIASNLHFYVPESWVYASFIKEDYERCERFRRMANAWAFGEGLRALEAHMIAWDQHGF